MTKEISLWVARPHLQTLYITIQYHIEFKTNMLTQSPPNKTVKSKVKHITTTQKGWRNVLIYKVNGIYHCM